MRTIKTSTLPITLNVTKCGKVPLPGLYFEDILLINFLNKVSTLKFIKLDGSIFFPLARIQSEQNYLAWVTLRLTLAPEEDAIREALFGVGWPTLLNTRHQWLAITLLIFHKTCLYHNLDVPIGIIG